MLFSLRVMQNAFAMQNIIAILFFLFTITSTVFGRTGKSFLSKFRQLFL